MAFRDINPAAVNPLAYAELAAAPSAAFLSGQQRGAEDVLLQREVARDDATRAALAGYFEAPPEHRASALNALAGVDPNAAAGVMAISQAQAAEAAAQRQQQALKEYTDAEFVLGSNSPALALRLLDTDGSFLKQLEDAGMVDSADGISDDEARLIAQWARDQAAPIAGIGQERAEPAAIREMRELGFDLTPEGFEAYNASKGAAATDPTAALLANLQVMQRQDQIDRERRETAEAERVRSVERAGQRSTILRSLEQTKKIVELTDKLQGTFLEAGVAGSDVRRQISGLVAGVGSMFGADTSGARSINDAYDQLKKNTADQLINLMQSGKLGEVTEGKLRQYQQALASPETSAGAIMSIQANIAEILLDQADAEGYDVPNRAEVEERITKLRGYETPAPAPVVDVPAIAGSVMDLGNGVTLEFLEE